jgi:hypothetical protein
MLSNLELTSTCSIIMPHPTKASAWAKAKRQSGQPIFTHVEDVISEDGSVYNDLGEEQTCSEWDEDTEETEDELECISSLQRFYTVFLPPHLKQQHPVSNWQVHKFKPHRRVNLGCGDYCIYGSFDTPASTSSKQPFWGPYFNFWCSKFQTSDLALSVQ